MKDTGAKGFYGAQFAVMGVVLGASAVKAGDTAPQVAFEAAFGAVWPLILYCAATYTVTWWANLAIMMFVFTAITPELVKRAGHGWYSHNDDAIGMWMGGIVVLGMTGSLIYSIALMRPPKEPKADE